MLARSLLLQSAKLMVCSLLILGSVARGDGQNNSVSPSDRRVALELFAEDGLMTILRDYYKQRGFTEQGAAKVTARPDLRYCPTGHQCYDLFDVSQTLADPAGDVRVVQGVVEMGRFAPFFNFLFDRYDHRTVQPIAFVGVGADRALSIFSGAGEILAMWINHAGLNTPGADSGRARFGMQQEPFSSYYFYVRRLSCVERSTQSTCEAVFVSGASFVFDAEASNEIIERLKSAPIHPKAVSGGQLYEAHLVDCDAYESSNPGTSGCWVIGS